MKRPYQITSLVFIVFSAFIAREAFDLKYYTSLGPGPGFFPLWLSGIMIVLSAFMFSHATWGRSDPMPADFFASRVGYLKALAVAASIVFVVFAMDEFGFKITMAAFFAWLLLTLGRLKGAVGWVSMGLVVLGGSWGAFWVFNDMLKVPLPLGSFGI
ncbi:MAG TPA: tripartite tricarboxylate transporter TctB family protein [Chloroflexota bacterium]